jgi:hypothetical protein
VERDQTTLNVHVDAMMVGIIVGTVWTLLFPPALHVAWFWIEAPPGP